jgi:hypothetical protein
MAQAGLQLKIHLPQPSEELGLHVHATRHGLKPAALIGVFKKWYQIIEKALCNTYQKPQK